MKNIVLVLLAFAPLSLAQTPQSAAQTPKPTFDVRTVQHSGNTVSNTPTDRDMYCSGFITTQKVPENHRIVGGQNSPDQSHYAGKDDRIFISGGSDIKAGDLLQILRPVRDPNSSERYSGQHALIKRTGQPYFERGYVRVLEMQKNLAIAVPELSCSDMIAGDLAIPFVEHEKPVFRDVQLDRYAPPNGLASGRIVMGNEFDTMVGSKQKVYLNIGENKGLKVGDYLRVTRSYDYVYREYEPGLSARATETEETVYRPRKIDMGKVIPRSGPNSEVKEFPRLTLGDLIVLSVHPRSATAMVMTALQDIRIGDAVEVMDTSAAPEAATH